MFLDSFPYSYPYGYPYLLAPVDSGKPRSAVSHGGDEVRADAESVGGVGQTG